MSSRRAGSDLRVHLARSRAPRRFATEIAVMHDGRIERSRIRCLMPDRERSHDGRRCGASPTSIVLLFAVSVLTFARAGARAWRLLRRPEARREGRHADGRGAARAARADAVAGRPLLAVAGLVRAGRLRPLPRPPRAGRAADLGARRNTLLLTVPAMLVDVARAAARPLGRASSRTQWIDRLCSGATSTLLALPDLLVALLLLLLALRTGLFPTGGMFSPGADELGFWRAPARSRGSTRSCRCARSS